MQLAEWCLQEPRQNTNTFSGSLSSYYSWSVAPSWPNTSPLDKRYPCTDCQAECTRASHLLWKFPRSNQQNVKNFCCLTFARCTLHSFWSAEWLELVLELCWNSATAAKSWFVSLALAQRAKVFLVPFHMSGVQKGWKHLIPDDAAALAMTTTRNMHPWLQKGWH